MSLKIVVTAVTAVTAGLLAVSPALANLQLAQKNACMACHAVDKKLVGPSYQDVAKKYAGQKDAEATLVKSIKGGGSGKWGSVPMPAQAGLSDADAKSLAAWVLGGAK
jgi:cytochrome c